MRTGSFAAARAGCLGDLVIDLPAAIFRPVAAARSSCAAGGRLAWRAA